MLSTISEILTTIDVMAYTERYPAKSWEELIKIGSRKGVRT
jgi:hypothetical protein